MLRPNKGWLALALCLLCSVASTAEARKQRELPYAFAQVWSTALRLVRVDLKLPVTDRDAEGGYVLFTYLAGDKGHPGSIELAAQPGERVATVVVVHVEGQPSYVAQMILDRLEKKLRSELGAPPARPRPAPASPPPDAPDAAAVDAGDPPPA